MIHILWSIATNNISNIVRAMPNLAEEAVTFLKRVNMTPKNNYNIKSEAIRGIAVIAKMKPTHATFIFLKTAITNPKTYSYFKPIIAESIIGIVKIMPSLAQQAFTFLREIITTLNTYNIENYAIRSIAKIVEINSSLALKAFTFLKVRVIDDKDKINYAAAISLIEVAESALFDKSSYKPINELLKIIEWAEAKDSYDNHLHTDATFVLNKITNHITQEYEKRKNPKMIKWFNGCFKELPNITETRVFLKEICKTILKSGVINQLESQFILNCVKNYHFTFTVAVNKDHKKIAGEIIFEDRRYEIFKNDNLEEFATMLLAATDDPLAEQYKTHKPLFQSKGLGLKIAASDIMEVNSITYEKTKLPTEASLLSYVRDIKDNSVILLEKRNVFGNHLIYKFNNNNFENVATIYPPYISNEIRKQIFEELESEKLIPCFIKNKIFNFNRCELVNEKGKSFLQNVKNIIQDEKVELQTSNFKLLNAGTDKRLDTHEEIIDDLGKDLKDGGITNKAEINREVERLKEENPKLYNYCNALFWNTKNILKACGIAETEFFKNNIKKTIGERIILFGIKFFNPVIKDLPFVGAIADFITDTIEDIICVWLEKRQDRKLKNEIISINNILRHKIGMQDVEDYFKKIAITITHARKNEIINPKEISQPNSLVQKFQACVQEAGNMIYDKTRNILLPEIIESCDKDNKAVQLALKDSIAFINYLYTNYDDILNDDFDLYEQCKKIVENGTLDALFTQTNKKF
ncbi:hypothetical protein A3306_02550 [Rickettsia bellii]|uniref:Uncharacterized protein n=2 Tax=Rickettsia bellii TaxID=33990 RepID=Q1RGR7_RICBR|nr:hypothetical protein [Rickettsia bellii]ABE05447.1 unknown [Rickettsia bellii RML369-C]ARD86118.1 hypothetical protein A3306_02550 [Rickettsia bellii]KJV90390.1 hypothetical protein RBEAN4_1393 [Rickettsia bellii str. RML An4]